MCGLPFSLFHMGVCMAVILFSFTTGFWPCWGRLLILWPLFIDPPPRSLGGLFISQTSWIWRWMKQLAHSFGEGLSIQHMTWAYQKVCLWEERHKLRSGSQGVNYTGTFLVVSLASRSSFTLPNSLNFHWGSRWFWAKLFWTLLNVPPHWPEELVLTGEVTLIRMLLGTSVESLDFDDLFAFHNVVYISEAPNGGCHLVFMKEASLQWNWHIKANMAKRVTDN